MSAYFTWVIVLIAGLFVGWLVLKTVLTFTVPEHISGIALMKQEMEKRGLKYDYLPQEFFEECLLFAQRGSSFRTMAQGKGTLARKAELVRSLQSLADVVAEWERNPESGLFSSIGDTPNPYRQIFEKYGLRKHQRT